MHAPLKTSIGGVGGEVSSTRSTLDRDLARPGARHPERNCSLRARASSLGALSREARKCDPMRGLMSLEKSKLTDYVGEFRFDKLQELDDAIRVALALPAKKQTSI